MPSPSVAPEKYKQRQDTVNECLADGFAPLGTKGPKGSAVEEAGRRLGLGSGALGSDIRRGKVKPDWSLYVEPVRTPFPSLQVPEKRQQLTALQDENRMLRQQLKELDREQITSEEVRQKIMGLSAHTPEPPAWLIDTSKSPAHITGVPTVIWSDWHLGEVVTKAETNGVNEFNLSIAEHRIKLLIERLIDLCFHHMTSPRYPGVVIDLLGDIVSGAIHPELAETDEDDIYPLILWATDRLIWALAQIADKFGHVLVVCSPGNHGRSFDKKPRAKRYVYRNADWLIYCLLERHFQAVKERRIRFMIPATGECLYRIYNHRYMAVHGDDLGVKGGDGIIGILGPVCRGEVKMRHSQAQIGRDYDTLVMGHWHQALWLQRAIVNNAFKGYDEYARRMLRSLATPPSQLLWFTHPKRGITARWEVTLTDSPATSNGAWTSWERAA